MRPFDADGKVVALPFAEESGELRKLTVRGAGATLFAGMSTLAIQVTATVTLARILTPKEFGLIAMVTTFSLLLVNFGFNGFTEAVVQRDEINEALASTIFWINLGFGIFLTVVFAASGSLLARFFHDTEVQHVAEFVSLTIVATSVSTVHLALLKRAMRFSAVSGNDIAARFISVLVSIGLGLKGWGYWALAVGAIAQPVSTCIGALWLCRWMPRRPRRVPGVKESLNFALHTYGNFGVNYLSRNTDNLLVGWRFNAQSLGYYKKAYDLFALTANQFVTSRRWSEPRCEESRFVSAELACRNLSDGPGWNGNGCRANAHGKGFDLRPAWAKVGSRGSHFSVFWAGNRGHGSLQHALLDPSLNRAAGPMVPVGNCGVRCHVLSFPCWSAARPRGNCNGVERFLLAAGRAGDPLCGSANRSESIFCNLGNLEICL